MTVRRIALIIGFVVLVVLTNLYYLGYMVQPAPAEESHESDTTDVGLDLMEASIQQIQFGYNASTPIMGDDYQAFVDDVVSRLGAFDTLEIIGMAYANEAKPDLAMYRAQKVRYLFANYFDINRIKMSAVQSTVEIDPDQLCVGFNYRVTSYEAVEEDQSEATETRVHTVYFEENQRSLPISEYESIRTALELPQENFDQDIVVIGFADVYEEESDVLAKKRAWRVKSTIWDLGVDPLRIKLQSRVLDGGSNENRKVEIYLK